MAWERARDDKTIPSFILASDPTHFETRARDIGVDIKVASVTASNDFGEYCERQRFMAALPVLPLENTFSATAGQSQEQDAAGVVEAIETGVRLIENNQAAGLVTLPINKKSLYDTGFDHPGHTEFLGALADQWHTDDAPHLPVMMLAGPKLRTVPVTIHIPLKDVPTQLTTKSIIDTGRIVARDLTTRFGLTNPRLAFAGLNPHAGEGGALGEEDQAIVAPAIEALKREGIDCVGPLPADTMFHAAARTHFDVALCMYHDQALIPAKTLGFDDGVNVTLGLPFIRTSPDHGTAFDIAGTGKADPTSFIAALRMAREMADASS